MRWILVRAILAKLNTRDCTNKPELNVRGNFPYKALPPAPQITPETNENCTNCSICAELCPMEAIDFDNFRDIDSAMCILCCSCIKKCPEAAKILTDELIVAITKNLVQNSNQ